MTATEAAQPRMFTVDDIVAMLGGEKYISVRQVQRLAKRGLIPGVVRLGSKTFFQRVPVLAWIEGGGPGAAVLSLKKGGAA